MTTLQDQLREELRRTVALDMLHNDAADRIDSLEAEVAEYRKCADDAAAAHKVERDGLMGQVAALTKDAARWKMLAEMEASMMAGETLRFYIACPDKLDYVIELKHNAYGAAMAVQKE